MPVIDTPRLYQSLYFTHAEDADIFMRHRAWQEISTGRMIRVGPGVQMDRESAHVVRVWGAITEAWETDNKGPTVPA